MIGFLSCGRVFRYFSHTILYRSYQENLHGMRILLFHAKDDDNVPVTQTMAFAESLKAHTSQVTMIIVERGGHYESMINQG